jgi:hypothetical protein
MAAKKNAKAVLTVKAYQGDAKTLLAFNLADKATTKNLAGFSIQCKPDGTPAYYLQNSLRFKDPGQHAQLAAEPANSSVNAPIHKFRWLHVPGTLHQGTKPFYGRYTYTVTPRYFDGNASLQPIDPSLSTSVKTLVQPFQKQGLALGFTRGFTQSQAFVHHFGLKALIRPQGKELLFDTSEESGTNNVGDRYTYEDEYEWLGFTAREKIFAVLNEVVGDKSLHLDVFAYDLNEPDVLDILLTLAKQGRVRIILDNATLHHSKTKPTPEDQFEKLFIKAARKSAKIKRGKFKRYSHDKVFVVSNAKGAVKVLTGSTNFSVTGLYVNSNHVLVFEDAAVAAQYSAVFEEAWQDNVSAGAFSKTALANKSFSVSSKKTPQTEITFSPHQEKCATAILNGLVGRINKEGKRGKSEGSVLFAVMEIGTGSGPVYPALQKLHENQKIFSYGISDTTDGIRLYKPGTKDGVLTTGKPVGARLPPPFDQVRSIGGVGHQIHHKFVVCGFNGADPVVYCGSSNLALGGEESNGDNLLAIHDRDVATAFALEALGLVDHFDFLDRCGTGAKKGSKKSPHKPKTASRVQAAASAGWFLSTDDKWAAPYFDPSDLHCVDRLLFA